MKGTRGYIFSRAFVGERAPQHVQNIVIRDYCQRKGLHYLLSATEYAMENCFLILDQILNELPDLAGIAMYSLYQLPADAGKRREVFRRVLEQGKQLHFAVEGLMLADFGDIERIENLWNIRLTLPDCYLFQG